MLLWRHLSAEGMFEMQNGHSYCESQNVHESLHGMDERDGQEAQHEVGNRIRAMLAEMDHSPENGL